MSAMRKVPAIVSALLLAAHFLRSGDLPWMVLSLLFPALLWVRRPWAVRAVQAFLAAAAGIWTWTAVLMARMRIAEGRPWVRMACILGAVALLALVAIWLIQPLARPSRPQRPDPEP
ncbi:MAG TPA: hypothetical protein PLQ97_11710 [Myxococcota bacterium]|nr:hypothetical protein [Myxococcota bacterium]HQK51425.1 hypothetical protein [Myxococcota bacterium]